jgi:tetratricopeptide (TPR) repeat protein
MGLLRFGILLGGRPAITIKFCQSFTLPFDGGGGTMCALRIRVPALLLLVILSVVRQVDAHCRMHGYSPRQGGAGYWGGIQSALAAKAAWEAREARAEALRRAKNAEQQFAGAIKAQKEGKISLAATLYMRLALARPKNRHSAEAKQALAAMANEGRAQMKQADELLQKGEIEEAFKQLDSLVVSYDNVPRFNHEVAGHVQKLHSDPKYKAVLNEPRAAALVDEGQRSEAAGETCCAFMAYEQAVKLLPAASAKLAEERYNAMKQDPQIVAEAESCRKVRECLRMFHTAELLEKTSPYKAEELFKKILARSPASSEVHRCAGEELARLHYHGSIAKGS